MSCSRARRTRPVQARATAALLARIDACRRTSSVPVLSTEGRRARAALIRLIVSKQLLLAVVNCARRPHTMNMTSAAKTKRASLVGVAGGVSELGTMLDVQRISPQRPRAHQSLCFAGHGGSSGSLRGVGCTSHVRALAPIEMLFVAMHPRSERGCIAPTAETRLGRTRP